MEAREASREEDESRIGAGEHEPRLSPVQVPFESRVCTSAVGLKQIKEA